ncbi:MAG: efflux RND transporter periplasmic adaptor subunit [bacterium]
MKRTMSVVVLLAVVAILVGVRFLKKDNGAAAATFEMAVAEKQPLWIKVSATGLVEPVVRVEVKSKASGIVERLPIEMGDGVVRGQVIAELDPTEIRNDLEKGRAAWAVATQAVRVKEQALKRTEGLAKEGLVSEQDLENARLDLERARSDEIGAKLAAANLEEKLADTVLRSPIDGIVLEKRVEVGQVIASGVSSYTGGTAVAVIADLGKVYVNADVDETDIGRVALGQRVEVVPDAFPDRKFVGRVERISPQSQTVQNVTTFLVVSALDNSEGVLKAGMNVTTDILVAGKDEALTVPRRAVRSVAEVPALAAVLGIQAPGAGGGPSAASRPDGAEGNSNNKVVCVRTGDRYVFKDVTVGLADYDQYEITGGLGEGDQVVVFLTSRALDQSRQFVERRRGTGIPGMSKSGGGGH